MNVTPESKSTLTVTNENKGVGQQTWVENTDTWASSPDTWASQGNFGVTLESKNSLSISNENKN